MRLASTSAASQSAAASTRSRQWAQSSRGSESDATTAPTTTAVRANDDRRPRLVLLADVRDEARPRVRVLTVVRAGDPFELRGREPGGAFFEQLAVEVVPNVLARPPLEVGVERPEEREERREREQLLQRLRAPSQLALALEAALLVLSARAARAPSVARVERHSGDDTPPPGRRSRPGTTGRKLTCLFTTM